MNEYQDETVHIICHRGRLVGLGSIQAVVAGGGGWGLGRLISANILHSSICLLLSLPEYFLVFFSSVLITLISFHLALALVQLLGTCLTHY